MDVRTMEYIRERRLEEYFQNYRISVLEPCALEPQELTRYGRELADIFGYIKYSKDEEAFERFVRTRQPMFSEEVVDVINIVTNSKLVYEETGERRTMDVCYALDQIRKKALQQGVEQGIEQGLEQGLEQGIEQGLEQGLEQGIELGKKNMILALLASGMSKEELCERLELTAEQLQTIVSPEEHKK